MLKLPTNGYRPKSLAADLSLGIFDGLDNALWCYGFATVIFAGAMAPFLPLLVTILLLGWAMLGIWVAVTSGKSLHVVGMDEQAVVILAAISALLVAHLGADGLEEFGLSTMLAVMSLSSVAVALFFWLIGHYRLTRLLELMPYPVICGFMAGIGWLLLEAGVGIAMDVSFLEVGDALRDPDKWPRLLLYIAAAIFLLVATTLLRRAWALPLASLVLVAVFYAAASVNGIDHAQLVAGGWLFDIPEEGGALALLSGVSLDRVDTGFVVSVIPEILTIAFLALLTQSMSLSALLTSDREDIDTSREIAAMGQGNLLCALVASPPGSTDVAASSVYREFGASSRWMPLITSAVCIVMALFGSAIMPWVPKLLVGATVLLFAWQLFHEWMYENVRGFQPIDFAIVLIILGTVIFVGFMPGVAAGILLALLLFVLRYSMISAILGHYSLASYRSSVERARSDNLLLDRHGGEALVYRLRGFVFFGTANAVLDTIRDDHVRSGRYRLLLLDLKRVTGMDISALNTFVQIKSICAASGVQLLYSGVNPDIRESLLMLDAVSVEHGAPLLFEDADYAVEYMEDVLLAAHSGEAEQHSIEEYLSQIFGDRQKVDLIVDNMARVQLAAGETLFAQGEPDNGLYMLEQGSMTALIRIGEDGLKRVKKFRPGALIGELSAYTPERRRTATLIADTEAVLYHLSSESLARFDAEDLRLAASIHELIARTLGMRIEYMNRRLFQESE
jgi:SulP family sulfate permease